MRKGEGTDRVHLLMDNRRMEALFLQFFEGKGYEVVRRGGWTSGHLLGIPEAIFSPRAFPFRNEGIRARDFLLVEYVLAERIRQEGGLWIGDIFDKLRTDNPIIYPSYPGESEVRLMGFLDLTIGFVFPGNKPHEFLKRWRGCAPGLKIPRRISGNPLRYLRISTTSYPHYETGLLGP